MTRPMPARPYPLPYAVTQPAPATGGNPSSEGAATEPSLLVLSDDDHGELVARILRFAEHKRRHPEAAHDAIVVGKYAIVDLLDQGAMGFVCTAVDPNFGVVALKFPKSTPSPGQRERVLLEGKLLARVHHTNVLRVYEVGECEDTVFIATEYVEGASMRSWQAARPWPDVVRAYLDAARGLAAIHDCGVVHQDIKPDNLRVDTRGVVRVLDFGLAHLESRLQGADLPDHDASITTFYRGGTPGYMAPEQYNPGVLADARADQYAFCVALWEALHGALPYPAASVASTVSGPPAPRDPPHAPVIVGPRWLRKLLLRGLAPRKEDRFPDMHALVAAFEQRMNRRWWPVLAAAVTAAAVTAALALHLAAPALPMCEDHSLTAWNAARDRALAELAAAAPDASAAPVVDSLRAELTAHAARFSAAHAAACQQAHAAASPALASERLPCFEQRRRAVARVVTAVEQFAARHADDPRAPWAEQRARWLAQLDSPADCLAPHLPTVPLATSAAKPTNPDDLLTTPDAVMDAAITASLADDAPAARRDFLRLITLAADDSPAAAWQRARARLGLVELDRTADQAADELLLALGDAEASGDALLAADILGLLVFVQGDRPAPARALDHVPAALGKLAALGLAHGRRARDVHLSAAAAAVQAGLLARADHHLGQVAALRGDVQEPRELLIRAQLAAQRGNLPAALAAARAARDLLLRDDGPGTRPVADALRTLGTLQASADDPDAEATLLAALRIYDERLGPGSPEALSVHVALAGLHYLHDRLHHAREHAAPVARALGDLPPSWRATADLLLGHLALQDPADPAAAADHYRRALARLEAADTPAPLAADRWLARLGLARAEQLRGHVAAAREALAPVLAALDGDAAAYRPYAEETAAELARLARDPSSRP
ncbi:MAG: protein kinase [Myxococcales bacterium]|nr:protein kinase [Myxococcales bacterium]